MIVVQVAEKERAQRLLEIYNRMDARSHVVHEGKKFKKSDILQVGKWQRKRQRLICQELYSKRQQWITTILQEGRKLLFEGLCTLVSPPLLPGSSGGRGNRWGLFWASIDTFPMNCNVQSGNRCGCGWREGVVLSFIRTFPFWNFVLTL